MSIQDFIASAQIVTRNMGQGKKIKLAQQSGRPYESSISWIVEGDEA